MMVTMLQLGNTGEFLVRGYSTAPSPSHYKLAIKESKETTVTYLIEPAPASDPVMYRLRGTDTTFATISSLVAFYASAVQSSLGIK